MTSEPAPTPRKSLLPHGDRINVVGLDEPFRWLSAGWRDFRRAPLISFAYGMIFVIAGAALTAGLWFTGFEYLIGPLIGCFLFAGPLLTVGLYAISRDIETGLKPSLRRALTAWRANPIALLAWGLLLVLFLIVWMRLAVLIFAIAFPFQTTDLESIINTALFTPEGKVFLFVGTMVGIVMATIAFVTNVVALPMMFDREVDILQASVVSCVACVLNVQVMAIWAVLILLLTLVGIATAFIGLALTLPIVGHGAWHAYRAVVRHED